MSFNAESTHPYIMNSRIKAASGTGGIGNIPIASDDTVGGIMIGGSANPITITGSGNASVRKATSELLGVVKAGDGVTIDADGAISGVAYSTTEHKTGRKWTNGADIYEKTFHYEGAFTLDIPTTGTIVEYSTPVTVICNAWCCSGAGYTPLKTGIVSGDLLVYAIDQNVTNITDVTIEYVK